jgi:hypothetical protein
MMGLMKPYVYPVTELRYIILTAACGSKPEGLEEEQNNH